MWVGLGRLRIQGDFIHHGGDLLDLRLSTFNNLTSLETCVRVCEGRGGARRAGDGGWAGRKKSVLSLSEGAGWAPGAE